MNEPLFAYLPIYNWPDGSCYKYYELLKSQFGGIILYSNRQVARPNDYENDLRRIKPSLAFCHGDWLSHFRVPLKFRIPYIVFEHDVHSLRSRLTGRQTKQEKDMLENAAGVIFTSEDHREYCIDKYPLMTDNIGLVHLRPLRKDIAFCPKQKLPGKNLVYMGGIRDGSGGQYGYRGYRPIFTEIIEAGWNVHLFAAKSHQDTTKIYEKFGCILHPWVPYWKLLREMSQFTAGLQVFNKKDVDEKAFAYTQKCRPNKTWDYLAAGIPTIGLYGGNCAKIYVDGGWGITIPNSNKETLDNMELPTITEELRMSQAIENDIPVFKQVINTALKGNAKKVIKLETRKGENRKMDMKDWHIVKETVFEKGRLLYGRGRRITKSEAVRLGLVDKESDLKKKLEDRAEKRGQEKEVEKAVELKDEEDKIIDNYLKEHPEKKGKGRKSRHHK